MSACFTDVDRLSCCRGAKMMKLVSSKPTCLSPTVASLTLAHAHVYHLIYIY